ncbi:MAG: hypothetical protein PF440_00210 [Thiomicrorhabdus sp.]|jgi:hypothetical protein|nr:hypothetical protein [Thiomicrorhabdus sp.]
MRVRQVRVNVGPHFANAAKKKFGFTKYISDTEPCFWMACYGQKQLDFLFKHKAPVILAWSGGDIMWASKQPAIIEKFKLATNIRHIATSSFIANDLKKMGLPYTEVPLLLHPIENLKPKPLGDSVYIYKSQFVTYGRELNNKIKELMPHINFIECDFHSHPREDVLKEYSKCFLGLRFINHDGLSHTVCEMGLMGRKMIWNGNTPNAIPYDPKNINDIVEKINFEYENRKSGNYINVASQMQKYLDIGDDFLNI